MEHFLDADPTPFPYRLDYFRTGRVPMVDAAVQDKVVLESELAGLVELADALRSVVKQEDAKLHDIKRKLKEAREELQRQNTLFAGAMEDMRRQLVALQAQQAHEDTIVDVQLLQVQATGDSDGIWDESHFRSTKDKLSKIVKASIKEGWTVMGPVKFSPSPELDLWFQTMVKYGTTTGGLAQVPSQNEVDSSIDLTQ